MVNPGDAPRGYRNTLFNFLALKYEEIYAIQRYSIHAWVDTATKKNRAISVNRPITAIHLDQSPNIRRPIGPVLLMRFQTAILSKASTTSVVKLCCSFAPV